MATQSRRPLFPMPWSLDNREDQHLTSQDPTTATASAITATSDAVTADSPVTTASSTPSTTATAPPTPAERANATQHHKTAREIWAAQAGVEQAATIQWTPGIRAETVALERTVAPLAVTAAPIHRWAEHHAEHVDHHGEGAADGILCSELHPEATLGLDSTNPQWSSTPLLDPALTFRLHSDPTASRIIYLDFDGHTTKGTSWNTSTMGSSFYSPAYDTDGNAASFNSTELNSIQQIWQRVASDFAPFDVNVTTQAPPLDWLSRSSSTDTNYGIRVVITSYGPYSSSAGGVAFVGTFTANSDTPAFVYNRAVTGAAEAISHEVGHTLGLSHDGRSTRTYYTGHGSGETSWAPIMGSSYNRSVTSWDIGQYTGTNNGSSTANYGKGPDDLAVITQYNGFGYQPDLVGNTISTATALGISAGQVNLFGTIETRQDVDLYSFDLVSSGDLDLSFDPYWTRAYVDEDGAWGGNSSAWASRVSDVYTTTSYVEHGSNLDLSVALYNGTGKLLATSNPGGLAASLSLSGLAAGRYVLSLDGTGFGDPMAATPTGYTDSASLGFYRISGTINGTAGNQLTLASEDQNLDPITGSASGQRFSSPGNEPSRPSLPGATPMSPNASDRLAIPVDNGDTPVPPPIPIQATPLAAGFPAPEETWMTGLPEPWVLNLVTASRLPEGSALA